MRHVADFMASAAFIVAWLIFGLLLFVASMATLPFLMLAFTCGRFSRR